MSSSTTPSSASKRTPALSANSSTATSSSAPSRSPTRQSTTPSTMSSGPTRATSIRSKNGPPPSAKAAAKRNSVAKDPAAQQAEDDDAKAETAALIDDLKDQLRKTESASEQYQKELQVAQSRLDEALAEQTKLEETANQHAETISTLETQLRDLSRHKTDLETQRTATEANLTQEREASSAREAELKTVVQRLKDTLAQRESRQSLEGEDGTFQRPTSRGRIPPNSETAGVTTPPLSRRDSSQNTSQLILQKDRIIEDLRLELAEAHVKVMEVDHAGGGRQQELEKQLLEVRMTNAKLMEDNESYQFLLQERTLNGTFANRFRSSTPSEQQPNPSTSGVTSEEGGSSLADELENANADAEIEEMKEEAKERRRVDKEMTTLRDQNKAMTLYIDKIITKLMASDHYEAIFDGTMGKDSGATEPAAATAPSAPAPADSEANAAPSLLQRAGSLFGNRARPTRPANRTVSQQSSGDQDPINKPLPTANEDPTTAPSVPLRRGESGRGFASGHRRTGSDRASQQGSSYTTFTTRTPSGTSNRPTTPSGGSRQPSVSTTSPPRDDVILEDDAPPDAADTTVIRTLSDTGPRDSMDVASTSSPPRSVGGASSIDGSRSGSGTGGAAMFSGSSKTMRPLKLVQEKAEADAERKKANRGSWAGWFNKATENLNLPGALQGQGSSAATGGSSGAGGPPGAS